MATKKPTELTAADKQAIAETVTRKPRYMQEFKEDLAKNPPSAVPPDVMETYIRGGRPSLYDTPEQMQEIIVRYFRDNMAEVLDEDGNHMGWKFINRVSLGDLAIYLGMEPSTLREYAGKDKFSATIKRAKSVVENYYIKALQENRNPAGICFIMKNGFGWKDIQDVKLQAINPYGNDGEPDTIAGKYQAALPAGGDVDDK